MVTINERVIQNVEGLDAARPLVQLVDSVLAEFPDLYSLANEQAVRIVQKHTGRCMDPRFIWWHQFNTESTSPRSFTGWQHSGPPQKSLLLTELVIERFDLYFQDASDELDMRGGFYRQGAHAASFDERNEVRMLGSEVQKDLWALDFAVLYRNQVERFWSLNSAGFRVLSKLNLLGLAASAQLDERLTALDCQRLRALLAPNLAADEQVTLAKLREDSTSNPLVINRYVFGDGDRGGVISLQAPDGRSIVYLPWSSEALRGFDSELAMASWLRTQLQTASTLEAFIMGAHSNPHDRSVNQLIRVHLQGIADSRSEQAGLIALSLFKRPVQGDFISWLASQAAEEMGRNAQLLQDNARLRKAMYSGYLSVFLNLFGGFAALGWPLSLILLGASVTKVGLDVDEAVHAADEHARKRALRLAMLDTVYATLNMVDVGFASTFSELAYEPPPHEASAHLEQWQPVEAASLSVEGQESNAVISAEVVKSGRLRGLRVQQDGSCWIVLNGLSFRVRYSHALSVWLVVPAENPYAFLPLQPVRLNEAGEWELLVPPRLLGGAPPDIKGISSARSALWDTYTRANPSGRGQLGAGAMTRQEALLSHWPVAELPSGQLPDLDQHGLDSVLVGGRRYYSYRYRQEYFNSLIEYYTSSESSVNDVFRSGVYKHGDEDDYIERLADSLALLPQNNEATLYRGGHRSRSTGGQRYREGHLRVGDVLVNSDITSFTENPYKVAEFASLPFAQAPGGVVGLFDDTSIVFELPAGAYRNATPVAAFSVYMDEGESIILPGHYFRIEQLEQVYGEHYRFIKVSLREVDKPASGTLYDLRTALPFDLSAYRAQFRKASISERFFPS